MKMTTYLFEVAAKNAVIDLVAKKYHEDFLIEDISVVWMTHVLAFKKAVLIDNGENDRMYEVTYNWEKDEMYVDIYEKQHNAVVTHFNFCADACDIEQ